MALKWIEGFEIHQGTGWLTDKYAEVSLSNVLFVTGRVQGFCIQNQGTTPCYLRTPNLGQHERWIVGMGIDPHNSPATLNLIEIRDVATGGVQLTLLMRSLNNSTYRLEVLRGSTVLSQSVALNYDTASHSTWPPIVDSFQHPYLQFQAVIDPIDGLFEVLLNGSQVLDDSGINTAALGNTNATGIGIGFCSGSLFVPFRIDDIYICDGGGSINNDYLDDCIVEGVLPTGNGEKQEWFGTNAGLPDSAHGALLDDPASGSNHDSDSTYISTLATDRTDLEVYANLSWITGNIKGIMVHTVARLEAPGSSDLELRSRSGDGVEALLEQHSVDAITYANKFRVVPNEPVGGLPWTVDGFNATQFGVRTPST